jgi:predicted RNA binding protein YcfA (HicA-like mRNA interferase family)
MPHLSREARALGNSTHFQSIPQNLPPRRETTGRRAGVYLEPESDDDFEVVAAATAPTDSEFVAIAVEDGLEYVMNTSSDIVPNTLQEAMKLPDKDKWLSAGLDEIRSHLENGTWELVRLPHGKKAIGCRWVFKIKKNADGTIDKYKGRVVVKGYEQRYGVDYTETFAPTARFGAIRSVIALAAIEDMELESVDISTAFLNAEIDAEIYMKKPEGYEPAGFEGPEWVLKLLKGLYGIKQGPHIWSVKLHNVLKTIGFKRIETDHSVFIYERDGTKIVVPVHVDDLLLASKSLPAITKVKNELKNAFKIHDQGPTKQILGIKLDRDRSSRSIYLSQPAYIEDMLRHYKLDKCNPAATPMIENLRLSSSMSPQNARELAQIDQGRYREAVGKLLYLSIATRPDISYAVGVLCRYNSNPGEQHWQAVTHLLRYLRGTTTLRLMYSPTSSPHIFTTHCDSDLGGNVDDSRSTAGHVLSIGTGAVAWGSRLQRQVSLSSTESEYTTASATGCELMWMRFFLEEIGYNTNSPSPLCMDSASALQVVKNPDHQSTMKHVHRSYNWIRERVAEGDISIQHVPGTENVADIFTKPLGRLKFTRFRDALGLRE